MQDSKRFSHITATTAFFPLEGGLYAFAVVGTISSGSVGLGMLAPDGSTAITQANLLSGFTSVTVPGTVQTPFYLPPGQYRVELSGTGNVTTVVATVSNA